MTVAIAGWHGKLPTVSDFASRRLDPRLIELWDEAVSASLAALREAEGERWVDLYLTCPIWRFLFDAGALPVPFDVAAWSGVLMPSVDRVGRYYPLILAGPLGTLPNDQARLRAWRWLDALEDAAFGALDGDWTIDQLEAELTRVGLPPDAAEAAEGEEGADMLDVPLSASASAFLGPVGAPAAAPQTASCRWYSRNADGAEMVLMGAGFAEAFAQVWTANLEQA